MSEIDSAPVLTIGHSNHVLDVFLALLRQHRVTAVADVRSAPYSRFNPQFNREPFAKALEAEGIRYVPLGNELGGRSDDPACYEGGRIRYDRVAATASFRSGLARVVQGAAKYRIALMCAEKEPLDCHRTLLVARALDAQGVDIAHIHADGAGAPPGGNGSTARQPEAASRGRPLRDTRGLHRHRHRPPVGTVRPRG